MQFWVDTWVFPVVLVSHPSFGEHLHLQSPASRPPPHSGVHQGPTTGRMQMHSGFFLSFVGKCVFVDTASRITAYCPMRDDLTFGILYLASTTKVTKQNQDHVRKDDSTSACGMCCTHSHGLQESHRRLRQLRK